MIAPKESINLLMFLESDKYKSLVDNYTEELFIAHQNILVRGVGQRGKSTYNYFQVVLVEFH
jgi:hypothetical protein